MEFRTLTKNDLKSYRDIRIEAFKNSPESFSESYEDEEDLSLDYFDKLIGFEDSFFTLGCFENDVLLGVATFKRDPRSKARHKAFVHTMYVKKEKQGQGIGTKLLNKIFEKAVSMKGLEYIHLWVLNPESSIAKRAYEKAGFVAQGSLIKNDLIINGKYVDALYMVKDIRSNSRAGSA